MQPTKQNAQDRSVLQNTVTEEQALLQQAISLFDMQLIQPVAMAFPQVISDTANSAASIAVLDIHRLFAQQEQLFNGMAEPVQEPQSATEESPVTADPPGVESAELQAIQQMYAQN